LFNTDYIHLAKVGTHNLKHLDVKIPLGQLTVVTGVSGSGKSSLVFDTLYGEAYRRYVESLSSFARQYLKSLPKPIVQDVTNLPPAVAVKQSQGSKNNRSTVGTMTEMFDLLRVVFTHLSKVYCNVCGKQVSREDPNSVAQSLLATAMGSRLLILAPLSGWGQMKASDLKEQLQIQGFSRAFINGEVSSIADSTAVSLRSGYIVVDRIQVKDESKSRMIAGLDLAFKAGRGHVAVKIGDQSVLDFNSMLTCCKTAWLEPSLGLLNYNHPIGACGSCQGFGRVAELDKDKILPEMDSSFSQQGVACWNFGKHVIWYTHGKNSALKRGLDIDKPFCDYSEEEMKWLWEGDAKGKFKGILGYFGWLDKKKYKPHYRIHNARFRTYKVCVSCSGNRLNPRSLACKIDGRSIAEISNLIIADLYDWFLKLRQEVRELPPENSITTQFMSGSMGCTEALDEGLVRLRFLLKVGVGYLSLGRAAPTLSGGEYQRINMARSLGSALTGTLFCLDEPTAGLHPRDSEHLLSVIRELRDQGNTVVVVEHDQHIIQGADHLIEVGPDAGQDGGSIVYEGHPRELPPLLWDFNSTFKLTEWVLLKNAGTNNLQSVNVKIPLNAFVAVCGVSGSGKSSLIRQTLYPLLTRMISGEKPDMLGELIGTLEDPFAAMRGFDKVVLVSQYSLSRSSRSNIATYLGVYGDIRKLFAQTPIARGLKLGPGHFSFNVKGGRCENCKGLGTVIEDLSFLGEMSVTCPVCEGQRFNDDVLKVKYREWGLLDILKLTITEAKEAFYDQPQILRVLKQICDMGLGYMSLGQGTSSFSGGEAQRLKLLSLLNEARKGSKSFILLDEPTTGLSDKDVRRMVEQLKELATKGHTVVVVEHHIGVLRSADWLIEIGPETAAKGGQLVYEGAPEKISTLAASVTGRYI